MMHGWHVAEGPSVGNLTAIIGGPEEGWDGCKFISTPVLLSDAAVFGFGLLLLGG